MYDVVTETDFKTIAPRLWSPTSPRAVTALAIRSRISSGASSLDGVGQPLQLLAQRGLGARQLVDRWVVTARREPLRVEFVGQPEVHKPVDERQHGGAGGESGRDEEIVVPELDVSRAAEAIHEAILRASL
jgi:hypothetical protein